MNRFPLPDLLRGFAVFLIVPVHILELFIDNAGQESLFGKILLFLGGPFAVPVFMATMGYFLARNKKTTFQNTIRGIKVFAVGFLLNIGLNFHLLWKIKFEGWQINPLEYVFGVDILYFAGLSIIVLSLIKPFSRERSFFAFALLVAVIALTSYLNNKLMVPERNYLLPFIGGAYSWAFFPLFPWLAYPLLGFLFFYSEEKIKRFLNQKKKTAAAMFIGIGALVAIFADWGFRITVDLPSYYHHTFFYSLWAIGIVILWAALLRFFLQKFPQTLTGSFLQWLGKNITLFYVIQWLIIGNIATAIYQTQPIQKFAFWFAGIFTLTTLLTWIISKTGIKIAR